MSLFLNLDDVPARVSGNQNTVSRKRVAGETLNLTFLTIVPPGNPHPHRHFKEELIYLLEGECEIEVETLPQGVHGSLPNDFSGQPSEKRRVKAGTCIRIPCGALHSVCPITTIRWVSAFHPNTQSDLESAVKIGW